MRITLITPEGIEMEAVRPYEDAGFVRIAACPTCEAPGASIRADKSSWRDEETLEGEAYCLECQKLCGTLRVTIGTIFGLEEDRRVLHGRCRVY